MLNFSFLSCQPKPKNTLPVEWQASVGAPELYPAFVYSGSLSGEGQATGLPTDGFLCGGWGETGLMMGGGKFVPERFNITWYSVVENKFFTGKFALPYDTIMAIFNQGVMATYGKLEPYDVININMAPGGIVVVWMIAQGERNVEIGRYQASEIEVKGWERLMPGEPDRDSYSKKRIARNPEIVKNLKENGIQYELYDSYRIRYPWKPTLQLSEGGNAEAIRIRFYNGEYDIIWGEGFKKNYFTQKSLPQEMNFKWQDNNGNLFGADVDFDEKEVSEAFKEIYKKDKDQETELVFIPDKAYDKLNVYLRSKTEEYWLRKTKTGIYTRTKD